MVVGSTAARKAAVLHSSRGCVIRSPRVRADLSADGGKNCPLDPPCQAFVLTTPGLSWSRKGLCGRPLHRRRPLRPFIVARSCHAETGWPQVRPSSPRHLVRPTRRPCRVCPGGSAQVGLHPWIRTGGLHRWVCAGGSAREGLLSPRRAAVGRSPGSPSPCAPSRGPGHRRSARLAPRRDRPSR